MKDTDKGFEGQARQKARSLIEALARSAQTEVEALKAAVDARTSALHKALSNPDHATTLDQLVQDLSRAAREEADAAAGKARAEVQQQAEAALKAARSEADRAREELEGRLAKAQAAADSARKELEARLAKVQAAAESAREEAVKQLDRETKRVNELAGTLESARRESEAVKAEAEKRKADSEKLKAESEKLKAEEEKLKAESERLKRELADAKAKPAPAAGKSSEPSGVALVERVGAAVRAISGAATAAEMFEALVEPLGAHFTRAVVFQISATGFKGWLARGLGSGDVTKMAVPGAVDALLKRALAEKQPVAVAKTQMPKGVTESAIERAVVFPIIAGGKAFAIAYGEDAEGTPSDKSDVGRKIAEILIDQATRRLGTTKPKAAQA